MKCWDCDFFFIKWEPIGTIKTGVWDLGRAICTKHNLMVEFLNHNRLKQLQCIEEVDSKLPNAKDSNNDT